MVLPVDYVLTESAHAWQDIVGSHLDGVYLMAEIKNRYAINYSAFESTTMKI
jgi:hypothetical protein